MAQETVIQGYGFTAETVGTVNFNEARQRKCLTDPTRPFEFDETHMLLVEEGIIAASRSLAKKAMLTVACSLPDLALSAAKHITDHNADGSMRQVRCYDRRDAEIAHAEQRDDSSPGRQAEQDAYYSFHILSRSLHLIPERATVIVNLTALQRSGDAQAFMGPFLSRDTPEVYIFELSKALAKRRQQLLFLLPDDVAQDKMLRERIDVVSLDAVKIIVAQEFPDDDAMLMEVRQQVERKLWTDNPALALMRARTDGILRRQIDQYRTYSEGEQRKDEQAFESLLRPKARHRPLNEAVLFVSCYFPRLSEPHFESVIQALLGDTAADEPEPEANPKTPSAELSTMSKAEVKHVPLNVHINLAGSVTPSGETHLVTHLGCDPEFRAKHPTVACVDLWQRFRNQVVRDCCIALRSGVDGSKHFDFVAPHVAEVASQALDRESPFHFNTYFPRVLSAGLVFHGSDEVADCTIGLVREGMNRAKGEYGWEWLTGWIFSALVHLDLLEEHDCSSLEQLVKNFAVGHHRLLVMSRWARLLQALLADQRLHKVAKDHIGSFIDAGRHDVVLALVGRLRTAEGMDTLHWLKRVIAEGNEFRDAARTDLSKFLRNNWREKPELIESLSAWLPAEPPNESLLPLQWTAIWTPQHVALNDLYALDLSAAHRSNLFPILAGQDLPALPSVFAQALALMLYPAKASTLYDVRPLLDDLAALLSCGCRAQLRKGEVITTGPLLALILDQLRDQSTGGDDDGPAWAQDADFAAYIHLMLVAWFWVIQSVTEEGFALAVRASIADEVCKHLDKSSFNIMRKISNDIRRVLRTVKKEFDREPRKKLARLVSTSKVVSNVLSGAQKRLSN